MAEISKHCKFPEICSKSWQCEQWLRSYTGCAAVDVAKPRDIGMLDPATVPPLPVLNDVELYAWVGMDEHGSAQIGLKQALVPAGLIPLVAVRREKMEQVRVANQMHAQAEIYGKKIRLCRFVFAEVIQETPSGNDDPGAVRPSRKERNDRTSPEG